MGRATTLRKICVIIFFTQIDISGTCSCLPTYDPICGEDGVSYKNPCILFCLNWSRKGQGLQEIKEKCRGLCECCDPKPCNCTRCYDPVCGDDGITYTNACTLRCKNKKRYCKDLPEIKISCYEKCETCFKESEYPCKLVYDPVCGSDGETYSNQCRLDLKNLERDKDGLAPIEVECEKSCEDCLANTCLCDLSCNTDPVCGFDGKTYNNSCLLDCENKKRINQNLTAVDICCNDSCENCDQCKHVICPQTYKPVCGSDGHSYRNKCEFNNENKRRKFKKLSLLRIQCEKSCDKCTDEPCICSKISKPLCADDGKTYSNECHLNCENIKRSNMNLSPLKIVCKRECHQCIEEVKRCDCPLIIDPVCSSYNLTHSNACQLDCENYQREQNSLKPLTLTCKNTCNKCLDDKCVCDRQYEPVCGSDKISYSNLCNFNCENNRRHNERLSPLTIICEDKCQECQKRECACPQIIKPICGSDGNTYENECQLNCFNEKRKHQMLPAVGIKCNRACEHCPKPEKCVCSTLFEPVCGVNNKTYSNNCIFSCVNSYRKNNQLPLIQLKCEKSCDKCFQTNACDCPEVYNPICTTNELTFENECMLICENKKRKMQNLSPLHLCCKNKCQNCPQCKKCSCPKSDEHLCGSDGLTYDSECILNCENKYRISHGLSPLTIVCRRLCKECIDESCLTVDTTLPVCGTDGNTYKNEASLDCENKKRFNKKLEPLKIKCKRDCNRCDQYDRLCQCKNQSNPICGSNNVTFANICLLDCENVYREKNELTPLTVMCKRPCSECTDEQCACTKEKDPVCGSDSKTYSNGCLLDCENKRRFNQNLELIEIICDAACENCDEEIDRCSCDDDYEPVCGSDGVTYDNFCHLDCGNFLLEQEELPSVELISRKEC